MLSAYKVTPDLRRATDQQHRMTLFDGWCFAIAIFKPLLATPHSRSPSHRWQLQRFLHCRRHAFNLEVRRFGQHPDSTGQKTSQLGTHFISGRFYRAMIGVYKPRLCWCQLRLVQPGLPQNRLGILSAFLEWLGGSGRLIRLNEFSGCVSLSTAGST